MTELSFPPAAGGDSNPREDIGGAFTGGTQASPQQKKGPVLSVVESSDHPPPHAPGRLLLPCASPPSLSTPSNSERRAGATPHTSSTPSPPWTARGWVGVGCTFGRQSLAACTPSCHLEHSFWNFPYVSPVIFSLSRGSHQSLNSKDRGREWSVPFGLCPSEGQSREPQTALGVSGSGPGSPGL